MEHTIRLHGNNIFKCSQCNFSTKLRRFLMRHIRKVHQVVPVENTIVESSSITLENPAIILENNRIAPESPTIAPMASLPTVE